MSKIIYKKIAIICFIISFLCFIYILIDYINLCIFRSCYQNNFKMNYCENYKKY